MKQFLNLCIVVFILNACSNDRAKNKDTTKEDVKTEIKEAVETTHEYTMEEQEEFLNKTEALRDSTKMQISKLKKKLKEVKKERKEAIQEKVDDLEKMQRDLGDKIMELKGASKSAYEDIRMGVENALSSLEIAIEEAGKEFD